MSIFCFYIFAVCQPGYYEVNDLCEPCAIGSYKETLANSKCIACNTNFTTDQTTSTNQTDCGK